MSRSSRADDGVADFDDLLVWAWRLLLESAEARAYFRRRFRVLLVDEFQDTDSVRRRSRFSSPRMTNPGRMSSRYGRGAAA